MDDLNKFAEQILWGFAWFGILTVGTVFYCAIAAAFNRRDGDQ